MSVKRDSAGAVGTDGVSWADAMTRARSVWKLEARMRGLSVGCEDGNNGR
jgi:hypothetical protein